MSKGGRAEGGYRSGGVSVVGNPVSRILKSVGPDGATISSGRFIQKPTGMSSAVICRQYAGVPAAVTVSPLPKLQEQPITAAVEEPD